MALSIKGTWTNLVKVRRGRGSLQITTLKQPLICSMMHTSYVNKHNILFLHPTFPGLTYEVGFFPDHTEHSKSVLKCSLISL